MKKLIAAVLFLTAFTLNAQKISTFDMVKIKAQYEKEALYFYEQNWRAFRVVALKQKVISNYEMFRSETDSTNHFYLTLVTTYKNEKAFKESEAKFRPIMSAISPNGPKYLNALKRTDFLEYVAGSEGKIVYSGKKNK
jgi:hypothetical protein